MDLRAPSDAGVVIVTGGAGGLGKGIAEALVAGGYRTVVADIAGEAPAGAAFERLDLRDADAITPVVDRIAAEHGPISGLVNNAGIALRSGLDELQAADLDPILEVNVRGTALVTAAVARTMARTGGGAVVTITSLGARQPTRGLGVYEASKAALEALTRATALEFATRGVRANAVAPGPIATPMTAGLVADPAALAAWQARIPLGRIATIDDVVPAVLFLLSPLSGHMTGSVVTVDGGQSLT